MLRNGWPGTNGPRPRLHNGTRDTILHGAPRTYHYTRPRYASNVNFPPKYPRVIAIPHRHATPTRQKTSRDRCTTHPAFSPSCHTPLGEGRAAAGERSESLARPSAATKIDSRRDAEAQRKARWNAFRTLRPCVSARTIIPFDWRTYTIFVKNACQKNKILRLCSTEEMLETRIDPAQPSAGTCLASAKPHS